MRFAHAKVELGCPALLGCLGFTLNDSLTLPSGSSGACTGRIQVIASNDSLPLIARKLAETHLWAVMGFLGGLADGLPQSLSMKTCPTLSP